MTPQQQDQVVGGPRAEPLRETTRAMPTLIHVLAADPPSGGQVRTRSTLRTGEPCVGDLVWFEGTHRQRRALTIVSMERTPRWLTIDLRGSPEDIGRIAAGTYLYRGAS